MDLIVLGEITLLPITTLIHKINTNMCLYLILLSCVRTLLIIIIILIKNIFSMSFKRNIGYGNQYYTNNESFNRNNMQYRIQIPVKLIS